MNTSEASTSSLGNSGLAQGSSAGQPSQTLPQSPGSPPRREQPEGGPASPRKLPHCRDCRRPMKGHHKYADCPRVKAANRRLRARARFHGKLKKLRTKVEVVEGSNEDIQALAQEAEDLRYKTCVVKGGKSACNHGTTWLVIGEDGRAVQNMGSELRKNLKTTRWGGWGAKILWKVLSSSKVQDVAGTWLQSCFSAGKGRLSCEQAFKDCN